VRPCLKNPRSEKGNTQNGRKHLQIVSDKRLVSRIYKELISYNSTTKDQKNVVKGQKI
jgi:hypothetical protein